MIKKHMQVEREAKVGIAGESHLDDLDTFDIVLAHGNEGINEFPQAIIIMLSSLLWLDAKQQQLQRSMLLKELH